MQSGAVTRPVLVYRGDLQYIEAIEPGMVERHIREGRIKITDDPERRK
jgi:hypothetical protein